MTFKRKHSALRREGREMGEEEQGCVGGCGIYLLLSKIGFREPFAMHSLKFWFSCSQFNVREAQTVPKSAPSAIIRTVH